MSSYYDSDDAFPPRSPPLVEVKPRPQPSPTPPPFIRSQLDSSSSPEHDSTGSERRRRPIKRRTVPNPGDTVLVGHLGPNYPDVSREAGRRPLDYISQSDVSDSDTNMDDRSERDGGSVTDESPPDTTQHRKDTPTSDPRDAEIKPASVGASVKPKEEPEPPGRPIRLDTHANGISNDSRKFQRPEDPSSRLELRTPQSAHDSVLNGHSPSAISPKARTLSVSQPNGPSEQTLPPLQNPLSPAASVGSPNQTLPSIKEFYNPSQAEKSKGAEEPRVNGYHRPSFSTTSGASGSPTLSTRHYSISTQRSPSSQLPTLTHPSPVSAHSDISPHDPFLKSSTLNAHNSMMNRRTSQASENGPPQFPPGLRTSSTSDPFSPSSQVSPGESIHRMSIESAIRPILPPPNPTVQTVPIANAGYRCEHPGCNAAPFSTQYLLNSHANVHSQNRPHYCPVPGCSRGEGGKGFKRKNEMIRHGLVHDSPGYICPFCPDREHRYPRPDNLQRYVVICKRGRPDWGSKHVMQTRGARLTTNSHPATFESITSTRTKTIHSSAESSPSDPKAEREEGEDEEHNTTSRLV